MKNTTNPSEHFFSMHDGSLHYGGVHLSHTDFLNKLNMTDEDWSLTLDQSEAEEWPLLRGCPDCGSKVTFLDDKDVKDE